MNPGDAADDNEDVFRYDDTVALITLDVMTTLHIDHLRYDDYDTLITLVMITNLVSPHLQARLLCFSPAVL